MDWSAVFSVTVLHGYIPQILLAEALYTLRLPRRSRFWLRLCIGLPVCAFLADGCQFIVTQRPGYFPAVHPHLFIDLRAVLFFV